MTNPDKTLYSFFVNRKVEKSKKEVSTDESGAEIVKTIKEIVDEPVKVVTYRPNRRQDDLAEEEYAVQFSKFLKKGLMTKAMLSNKYSDNGGLMSETDSKEYARLLKELEGLKDEHVKKSAFAKDGKKKNKELDELGEKIIELSQTLLRIENRYQNLFSLTAETKAETKRLEWYLMNLSFMEEDGKLIPVFNGADIEEKREDYYKKEESADEVYSQIIRKLWFVFAIWQNNRAISTEDLENFLKMLEEKDGEQ